MCRLFGYLGASDSPPEPWLLEGPRSLLGQSNADPKMTQTDGWGIAWFDGSGALRVEKGVHGAFQAEEKERFVSAARAARGPVTVAHLRHASNPLGLPAGKLLALVNSQPFRNGSDVFAHNGELSVPTEARPLLGPLESRIEGVNDSEVLFWLIERHLPETGGPLQAYVRARDDAIRVWEASGRKTPRPYSGLNVIFSRGPKELWAFCHWNGEWGPAIIAKDRPYYQMGYRATPERLIVGSEPLDTELGDWRRFDNGQYLSARREGERVVYEVGSLPPVVPVAGAR